jgi:hypothetical protein
MPQQQACNACHPLQVLKQHNALPEGINPENIKPVAA